MAFVEVSRLSRSFGIEPQVIHAVNDISFHFERGDIFGFIGPNGAGKSTAMRILATLDLPSSGDCTVGGLSTVDDADQVRRLIGYMPDSYGSYPNMSVWEYLDFFARAYALPAERRRRAVADVLEFCQLGEIREKAITSLSKGMKQRLCLGRCLIHDPQLLILDEPSAGLDPRARIEFRDLLRVLAGQGKAIFISSHILAELEELCTGVAIIEHGRLIATGRVAELKARMNAPAPAVVPVVGEAGAVAPVASTTIEIRLAAECDGLALRLAEEPGLSQVQVDHLLITAVVAGDQRDHAALLARLIAAGLPICHFATRASNLEDLFLHITRNGERPVPAATTGD
jgi:ABC-2 type transport system ATP-binding protein